MIDVFISLFVKTFHNIHRYQNIILHTIDIEFLFVNYISGKLGKEREGEEREEKKARREGVEEKRKEGERTS